MTFELVFKEEMALFVNFCHSGRIRVDSVSEASKAKDDAGH
jgi:hypothetical protein